MTKIAFKYYLSKNWGKDGGWPGRWFNGECGLFLENNIELTYHDYSLLQSFEREHSGSSFYEEPVHWSTEQSVFNDGIQEITKNLPNLLPKLNARYVPPIAIENTNIHVSIIAKTFNTGCFSKNFIFLS
jgi:hypothetical protein